jgi:hypothetical protein
MPSEADSWSCVTVPASNLLTCCPKISLGAACGVVMLKMSVKISGARAERPKGRGHESSRVLGR